jgi:hypothetical protein
MLHLLVQCRGKMLVGKSVGSTVATCRVSSLETLEHSTRDDFSGIRQSSDWPQCLHHLEGKKSLGSPAYNPDEDLPPQTDL